MHAPDFRTRRLRGTWLALAAALLFGAGTPLIKSRFAAVDPLVLASLISFGSGTGVAVLTRISWNPARLFARGNRALFAGSILTGGVAAPFLLVWGVEHSPGSAAALLLNLEAVFTALIAWVFFREATGIRVMAGLALVTAGGAAIVANGAGEAAGSSNLLACLAVAGSCLGWAIDNNCTVRLRDISSAQFTLWKGLIAGSVLAVVAAVSRAAVPAFNVMAEAFLLGTCCHGLALLCFVKALQILGAGRATAYFSTAPFVGAAMSALLLGEPFSARLALAAGLMAAGVGALFSENAGKSEA